MMADKISPQQRSYTMSRVRSKGNASTEQRLIAIMRLHRLSGWRRNYKLFGKPDFVFRMQRLAVFVDGDFWHGHPTRCRMPTTNVEFWQRKIAANRKRDRLVNRTLKTRGWHVVRIWESELINAEKVAGKLAARLGKA